MVDLRQFRRAGGERGFTLAEMLIAMAIFIIAATVAFLLYDNAQRSFKRGEEATEQQQVTRVAFDKMISDLRMAGFNYNPTGHPNRPDEQIEGAWATAVTMRADLDAEDPTQAATPETTLATGSPFSVVSTGNDEVVTYVLAKDAGGVGGDTLTFFADKDSPRNTTTEQIDINNVALASQSNPPYTLYRVTLDSTGAAVKEPLADNIKSLAFTYYDANGVAVDPVTMGGSEATANKANRAKIRRITVDVVGMTPGDDVTYTDASDAVAATEHRRKFDLVSDVEPRNLGMIGAADPDNSPPSTPTGLATCQGHCGGLLLTWNPNPVSEAVIVYNIKYGTSAASLTSLTSSAASPAYIGGLSDASTYYFAIQAQDAAGNKSNWTANLGPISLSSNTVPLQVQNLSASPSGALINLSWDAVGENTDAGASAAVGGCDPNRPTRRDSGGYKVYRKKNPSGTFTVPGGEDGSFASLSNTYADSTTVLCATYGYRVTAIDGGCSAPLEGAASGMDTAATTAVADPAKPTGGTAQLIAGAHAQLSWNPVTQDTNTPTPNTISVERYNLYDALVDTALGETPSSVTYTLTPSNQLTCSTPTSCVHNNGGASNTATRTRWYKVAAATDCSPPYDEGVLSDPFMLDCDFSGTPTFTTPASGADVTAGTVAIGLNVSGGSSTYTQAAFTATPLGGGSAINIGTDSTWSAGSPNFGLSWNAGGLSGQYRIDAVVAQADGCTRAASITVNVVPAVACCLTITSANVITQGSTKKELRITFDNFCGVTLTVDQMTIQMTSDPIGSDAKLGDTEFDSSGVFFSDGSGQAIESTPFTIAISPAKTLTAGTHSLTLNFKSNISNCAGLNNTFRITLRYTRPETGATTYTCTLDIVSAIVTCI